MQEAQRRLTDVLALDPNNPEILDFLALAKFRLGEPEEAQRELEQALEQFPAHQQSSVALAKLKLGVVNK